MNDSLLYTILIGGGLLTCGYFLGVIRGMKTGTTSVMNELFKSGLLKPEEVVAHYSRMGNEKAQELMATINQLKRANKDKENNDG
jgi:hypothetical protein